MHLSRLVSGPCKKKSKDQQIYKPDSHFCRTWRNSQLKEESNLIFKECLGILGAKHTYCLEGRNTHDVKGALRDLPTFSTVFRIRIRLDPHSIWAWACIRDPNPYLESGSGFRIEMSKNRPKKPKFTMTDSIFNPLRTRTEKCSD
jgi:hypothetical protein